MDRGPQSSERDQSMESVVCQLLNYSAAKTVSMRFIYTRSKSSVHLYKILYITAQVTMLREVKYVFIANGFTRVFVKASTIISINILLVFTLLTVIAPSSSLPNLR